MARRPTNWQVLLDKLEGALAHDWGYDLLSAGIKACISNAQSLLEDFSVLSMNQRRAGAQFMYTTAMEEMGKALILFDMVRIDWRHEWLMGLCKAFYHHLKKYGYAKTVISPGNGDLVAALGLYKFQLVEYWPNYDPESGEPSLPADGIANREWAIYVDWDEYGSRWFYPPDSSLAHFFTRKHSDEGEPFGKKDIRRLLDPLLQAEKEGLFEPNSLDILHSTFSQQYISADSEESVEKALKLVEHKLRQAGIMLSQDTLNSNFIMYPLYAAILTPEKIPNH